MSKLDGSKLKPELMISIEKKIKCGTVCLIGLAALVGIGVCYIANKG